MTLQALIESSDPFIEDFEIRRELQKHPMFDDRAQILGSGQTGYLFKSHRRGHPYWRNVAIKVFSMAEHKNLSDQTRARQDAISLVYSSWKNEFDVLEDLKDIKNVRKAQEMNADSPVHFFTLDYIGGQTLEYHLSSGFHKDNHDLLRAYVRMGIEILHVLEKIHQRGYTLGDLKPANIMIDSMTTQPILIDFGIAAEIGKRTSEQLNHYDIDDYIVGTPNYMSESQWKDGPRRPMQDLYAAGCIFYKILHPENKTPMDRFASENQTTIHEITHHRRYLTHFLRTSHKIDMTGISNVSKQVYGRRNGAKLTNVIKNLLTNPIAGKDHYHAVDEFLGTLRNMQENFSLEDAKQAIKLTYEKAPYLGMQDDITQKIDGQ